MNQPITWRDAMLFFVVYGALNGVEFVYGFPVAFVVAIALVVLCAVGLIWHSG